MHTFSKASISYDTARQLVDAAIAQAQSRNLRVAAAVVDESGQLKAFGAMDGVALTAIAAVPRKAQTALIGLGTDALAQALAPHPAALLSMALLPGNTLLGGGEPIRIDGQIVGALAVGGATTDEDTAFARAALKQVLG